jgi:threonine/homoserine/homoserine lactone efflux protein
VHPLLLDELAAARVDELRRQASRARRSLRALGFLLVGAGLRLATAGERANAGGRSVV